MWCGVVWCGVVWCGVMCVAKCVALRVVWWSGSSRTLASSSGMAGSMVLMRSLSSLMALPMDTDRGRHSTRKAMMELNCWVRSRLRDLPSGVT